MPLLNLLTQCPILQNPLAKGATQKINMHQYHNSDAYYITLGIEIPIASE